MKRTWITMGMLGILATAADGALTTNSWFLFGGKWEAGGNWSAGTPHPTNAVCTITNDLTSITVTIDNTTVLSNVLNSCLIISNLVVGRNTVISHTLFMKDAIGGNQGLVIISNFTLNATGFLSITNSEVRVSNPAGGLFINGAALLNAGNLIATNVSVGRTGAGTLTVSNGMANIRNLVVADLTGSLGTLTIAGGTVTSRNLSVAISGLTGTVWVTGGQLITTNESTAIGDAGIGQMTVSNGNWRASIVSHRQGTLTIAGGTSTLFSLVVGSGSATRTATVWMTGGNVAITNLATAFPGPTNDTIVGLNAVGQMTISNGIYFGRTLYVGTNAGSVGTFTMAGGVGTFTSSLSVGGSPGATGAVWLTGGTLAVTNGQTQVGASGVGQLTISNGTFLAREMFVGTNTGSQGTFTVAGSTNRLTSFLHVGSRPSATGAVWVTDGVLVITNSPTIVGVSGVAQLTLSNGAFRASTTCIGSNAGSRGALTIAGGTNFVNGGLQLGLFVAATGSVWITDGALLATNSGATIGVNGIGQLTISNGVYRTLNVVAGLNTGASGTLTFAGGTTEMAAFTLGSNAGLATGTVWLTGGELLNANGTFVGLNGVGRMTVSNGTWRSASVLVAQNAGSKGTLTLADGTNFVSATMFVGNANCTSTGIVTMTGGFLHMTNQFGFGTLDVRSGTFTMNGGFLIVDNVILTNSCAHFVRTGGTLIYSNAMLNPAQDTDGDGLPNGYEESNGFDPLDPIDAAVDADADGFTNLQEFQAGTDPNDANSTPFRITSIVRSDTNIVITWTTVGGTTNVVQVTPGTGNGSYSNNFLNITGPIVIPGIGLVTTNFTDIGGATKAPARYYRVKLLTSLAEDDASDPAYGGGWTNGSNGGIGFGPWILTGTAVIGGSNNGFFIGSSTNNAFGTSPGIDVGGKSWGMYANGGNHATAFRALNSSLQVGQSLLINMDNGFIDSGNADGFVLRNGNASSGPVDTFQGARFEFRFEGGTNNYAIVDNAGLTFTTIPFTGTGLRLKFTPTGLNTYSLQVIDNATAVTNTITGTMAGSGSLDSLAIYDRNAGSGSVADAFFNSLQITSP